MTNFTAPLAAPVFAPAPTRRAALAELLATTARVAPAGRTVTGLGFQYFNRADTVLCYPVLQVRNLYSTDATFQMHPLFEHPGTLGMARLASPDDGEPHWRPVQEVLALSDEALEDWMLTEARAWFAAQERQRLLRDARQGILTRLNSTYFTNLTVLLSVPTVVLLVRFIISGPLPAPLILVTYALLLAMYLTAQFFAGASPLLPPRPIAPERALSAMPEQLWHFRITPGTATPDTVTPGEPGPLALSAPSDPREQTVQGGLARSRAALKATRARLLTLNARQDRPSPEIGELLARTSEALDLITERERTPHPHADLAGLARTIDVELRYLRSLPAHPEDSTSPLNVSAGEQR